MDGVCVLPQKMTPKLFKKKKRLIHLFLAVLGLHFCLKAFLSCGNQGLPFVAMLGLLIVVVSLVMEHGF